MSKDRKKKGRVVEEIRDQAKEIAGQSGEALKGFADETGSAAKEFAVKTRDAAKELIEAIEKAAQRVEPPTKSKRRGRKLLGSLVVIGIGIAVVANEKIREQLGLGGGRNQPPPWEPRVPDIGNGEIAGQTATARTETP